MAELARNYHEKIQQENTNQTAEEREEDITNGLNTHLPKLDNTTKSKLAKKINKLDISIALASASNGKAAGLDGKPYELWKALNERHKNLKKENKEGFDIIKTLRLVFNDIENNGVDPAHKFNEGWMCPIYKKNDRSDIANYRPITALNTDYKLLTKALQAKLADAAPNIINRDQAGFMKGRSIFDQIKTIQLLTEYTELNEDINGAIIALDQEKAYDKIRHDYLWRTLQRMNLPNNFINTVKSLYTNAQTKVIINGELSSPFTVRRGVRQGDPLSCLLFNLAIEPLAARIRQSNIQGINIPKLTERLKVLLFADDTTVFLNKYDSFQELTDTLDEWCKASGAKFNKNKTEIIPIGSRTHCQNVRTSRKLNENNDPFPQDIRINNDGELVRILGAWFGNPNSEQPWTSIIDKTKTQLKRWEHSHPTLEGRRLINQMETGGRTQYLAKAQGMPKSAEKRINKIMSDFIWKSTRAQIAMKQITQPLRNGGRKILDIKQRNMAIAATDLQSYLRLNDYRPKWAYIADDIFRRAFEKRRAISDDDPRTNPFIQKWPPAKAIRLLTKSTKAILETAKKLRLNIEADEIDEEVKKELPIWFHRGTKKDQRQETYSEKSRHLRLDHKIYNVGQTIELARTEINPNHQENAECECPTCMTLEQSYNCKNPDACIKLANKLILKLD